MVYYAKSMASNNTRKLGKYQLLTRIATGGMAEIHLARQVGIGGFERLVVVKLIHPHLADEERFVEMFLDEARIAARLNHPNVVQIYDFGKDGDEYFIAMEYLEGESLGIIIKAGLESGKILDQHLAAGIITQVCDGLDYAHKFVDLDGQPLGIVHRDISPQNIIALYSGTVKLVDFGIAKAASKIHKTSTGTLKGKLTYMAPEQCKAMPVDVRTDVFALGAVFWEMLTLHRLFKRESEAAMIDAIVNEPIPNPRQIRSSILPEYEEIVMTALNRDPEQRFQSAGAMGNAIRAVIHQTHSEAGVAEIGAYVRSVLAGRQKAKQELLRELVKSNGHPVEFKVLKPDTEESIPHGPVTESVIRKDTETLAVVTSASTQQSFASGHERTSKVSKWKVLVAVFAVVFLGVLTAGVVGFWILGEKPGDFSSSISADGGERSRDGGWKRGKETRGQTGERVGRVGDGGLPKGVQSPEKSGETGDMGAREGGSLEFTDHEVLAKKVADFATVDIKSRPSGCKVELDGVVLDAKTPILNLEVTAGKYHEIRALCRGHKVAGKTFKLGTAQHRKVVFLLKPLKPVRKGVLRLDTSPWSIIYLGEKKLGMTPLVDMKLPAGTHVLTAINKDKGLRKQIKVRIIAGQSTSLSVDLLKEQK